MSPLCGSAFVERLCRPGDETLIHVPVAIVAAHPDDEVIGAGSRLRRLADLRVLHVTDGAPRDLADARREGCRNAAEYAALRAGESRAALALAGVPADRVGSLAVADQGASYALAEIARELESRWRRSLPQVVITHPYEGGHPDHDACAFAVQAACQRLRRSTGAAPTVCEMACYNGLGGRLALNRFLPPARASVVVRLDDAERELKRRMVAAFRSQRVTLGDFVPEVEAFRPVPAYDFTVPPHDGVLWYERFAWGCIGKEWRAQAACAAAELDLLAGTAA